MSERRKIIVIRETWAQSWLRDASTWALAVMLIVPGWYIESTALTATGIVIFWLAIFGKILAFAAKTKRYTLHEAREEIDRMISEDQA